MNANSSAHSHHHFHHLTKPKYSDLSVQYLRMATVISTARRFKLVFFVPPPALEACKTAIFAAGAGRYPGPGNYTECCWTAMGKGQFRPGDTANPHLGKVGALEEVQEVRVETLCVGEGVAKQAVEALKMQVRLFVFD